MKILSYADQIVALIRNEGLGNVEIQKRVGCTASYVRLARQRFCRDTLQKPRAKKVRKIKATPCIDCGSPGLDVTRRRCPPCRDVFRQKRVSELSRKKRVERWDKRISNQSTGD